MQKFSKDRKVMDSFPEDFLFLFLIQIGRAHV